MKKKNDNGCNMMQCVRYLANLNNESGEKNVQDVQASRLTVRQLKNKYK